MPADLARLQGPTKEDSNDAGTDPN
jgi:hypothetical protein